MGARAADGRPSYDSRAAHLPNTAAVFVLLNILLSVVMDLFNTASAATRGRHRDDALDSPSFARAVYYALLTSPSQLSRAADALLDMRRSPKPRLQMKRELRAAGVSDVTIFVLLEALGKRGTQPRAPATKRRQIRDAFYEKVSEPPRRNLTKPDEP